MAGSGLPQSPDPDEIGRLLRKIYDEEPAIDPSVIPLMLELSHHSAKSIDLPTPVALPVVQRPSFVVRMAGHIRSALAYLTAAIFRRRST